MTPITIERHKFFDGLSSIPFDDIPTQMDHCFNAIDDYCWAGKWKLIDDILANVDPAKMQPSVALGFLTITRACYKELKNREALITRVERHFLTTMDAARVANLMRGL